MDDEFDNKQTQVPLLQSPNKQKTSPHKSDSESSDDFSPRKNSSSSEEIKIVLEDQISPKKIENDSDSSSPPNTDSHSLTPSPPKNFMPLSTPSNLIVPQEEEKEKRVIDLRILPINTHIEIQDNKQPEFNLEKKEEKFNAKLGGNEGKGSPHLIDIQKDLKELKSDNIIPSHPKNHSGMTQVGNVIYLNDQKEDIKFKNKKEVKKDIFLIEEEQQISSDTNSSQQPIQKKQMVVEFLKESFSKLNKTFEKSELKLVPKKSSSHIKKKELTETSPLIQESDEIVIEMGKVLQGKAKLLQDAFLNLLAQDEEKTVKFFEKWIETADKQTLMESLEFFLDYALLPEDLEHKIKNLLEKESDLNKLTVQDWLEHMEFSKSENKGKKEDPLEETLKFYELFNQALASHVAYGLFMDEMENMDEDLKSYLDYFQQHKVEHKLTARQKWLAFLGVITAIGNSIGQGTVFGSGLKAFFDKIGLKKQYDGITAISLIVGITTTVLSFIDSLPRDVEECVKLGEPSQKKFSSHSKSIAPYLLALPLTVLAFYFLFNIEYEGIKYAIKHEQSTTPFWIYLGCIAPFLTFDAFLDTVSQLKNVGTHLGKKWDSLKGWLRTTGLPCLKKTLKQQPLSEEERTKRDLITSFKGIKKAVFVMADETVDQIYEDLELTLFKKKGGFETEELNAAEAFLLLSTFMKYFQSLEENDQEEIQTKPCVSKTWQDRLTTGLGIFFTGVASFARYAIYQYIMEYFLKSMGVTDLTGLSIGSNILGTLGFLIQGGVEDMAVEENIKNTTSGKSHPHDLHPKARNTVGILSFGVGVYKTLPSIVTGFLAMATWDPVYLILALIAYGFTDAHSTAWSLKDNYWSYYDVSPKKTNCCSTLGTDAKKYKIMNVLDRFITLSEGAYPRVVMNLDRMLDAFIKKGFLNTKVPLKTSPQSNQFSSNELLDMNSFHNIEEEKN
ncbi:MAG: hypothetical protein KBD90_05125 [Alphaproteobacteria bacterium]|nr:hypothetical protein [Alphaproteobacteria bacterium]